VARGTRARCRTAGVRRMAEGRPAGVESGWMERAWVPGENHRATLHLTRPMRAHSKRHAHAHAHPRADARGGVSLLRPPSRVSHIGSLLPAGCRIRIPRIRFASPALPLYSPLSPFPPFYPPRARDAISSEPSVRRDP